MADHEVPLPDGLPEGVNTSTLIVSSYTVWTRRLTLLLQIASVGVMFWLLITTNNNHQNTGVPIKNMLCAIGRDNATHDPEVATILIQNGCSLP